MSCFANKSAFFVTPMVNLQTYIYSLLFYMLFGESITGPLVSVGSVLPMGNHKLGFKGPLWFCRAYHQCARLGLEAKWPGVFVYFKWRNVEKFTSPWPK